VRRALNIFSIVLLVVLGCITANALYGRNRLSQLVPTHFNAAGQPDAWGSAQSLLILPGVALFLFVLMTVVSHYPAVFNYPVRVTAQNRAALEAIALNMIAWLKLETICIFLWIEQSSITLARNPSQMPPAWIMPAFIAVVFATILLHVIAIFRVGRR
jgi:hypothetical protein